MIPFIKNFKEQKDKAEAADMLSVYSWYFIQANVACVKGQPKQMT